MKITAGTKVTHALYGDGYACGEPVTVETQQWSGTAVWCCFYRPQTGIAAGWPYMVPVSDLTGSETDARTT